MHENAPVLRRPANFDEPPGHLAEWLADEVVVDFPSIGRAVERMRRPFVARPDTMPAVSCEVRLSAAEALRPQWLAVDVPVRSECHACGGRGGGWRECCPRCGGSGSHVDRRPVRFALPAAVADGDEFRFALPADDARGALHVRVSVDQW